ncbi:MAG: hypothetical protein WDM81_00255 [Rhizomicrobium sp.]
MIHRSLAVTAAMLLAVCAARAASDEGLASAILGCSAQPDETAQLACYNRIAARVKAASPAVTQTPVAAAPPPAPVVSSPPPQASNPLPDFGKENLPAQADAPTEHAHISARVADVSYNFFRVFTITLDNGQVWRQVDGDDKVARFRNDKTEVVTITRGFLDSYHLVVQGTWGDYTVKRIK